MPDNNRIVATDQPATPRLSATVLLVRDGARGLEVLMIVRHHAIDFASGAAVFPGGKIADCDRDARLLARAAGPDGLDADHHATRVAAIRETFEECGVLLARDFAASNLLGRERISALGHLWPARLLQAGSGFVDMVCAEALELALDSLVPFAHWVTPEVSPKRFDTHFFIARAPADQVALHDGSEAVDAFWIRPEDALNDCVQRRRTFIFPTLANLALLAQSRDVSDALAAARKRPIVRVQPRLIVRADGKRIPALLPDSGYPALGDELMELVARS